MECHILYSCSCAVEGTLFWFGGSYTWPVLCRDCWTNMGSHGEGDVDQQLFLHWLICSDDSLQITLNIFVLFKSFRRKYGAPSRNLGTKLHVAYYFMVF